ncbi:hypothetical protein M427DRAFT_143445 [Gonapodya prolifera JEL478]|uniref:Snf7-domain-containing protein n=1 Tax=Gonapodya prolifera (strain JEL478) TaxID=1344416 RepID=A0A139AR64_GONPJ|nr:hypothetical protein M427DRAFT_143445 [Gonapodya prolifera JEL478]|eukprot:KXS19228.1 hypothetical protein M427DRAFT_143445 [Gonapodya prolifera JEL478]
MRLDETLIPVNQLHRSNGWLNWAWNKASSPFSGLLGDEQSTQDFVVAPVAEFLSRLLLHYHLSSRRHPTDDLRPLLILKEEYRESQALEKQSSIGVSESDWDVLVGWGERKGMWRVYGDGGEKILKFHSPNTYPSPLQDQVLTTGLPLAQTSPLSSPAPLTPLEITISRLKLTYRTLLSSLTALRSEHARLVDNVKRALLRGDRREATRLLKKSKAVTKSLQIREVQVDAVGEVVEKLDDTAAQAEILSTMQTASTALRSLLAHHSITPSRVERVADDLREALSDQREIAEALDRENTAIQNDGFWVDEDELEKELQELILAEAREQKTSSSLLEGDLGGVDGGLAADTGEATVEKLIEELGTISLGDGIPEQAMQAGDVNVKTTSSGHLEGRGIVPA